MEANPIPGNPHFIEANHDNGSENFNVAQALLAVAFELRTANIIASMQSVKVAGADGMEWRVTEDSVQHLTALIRSRLKA